ncbi:MAG: hypothetical protein IK082_05095 [Oscillospiraceae bacterium]|nr:hypothetical protein [Oscillospiraceae bacterium]
MRARIVTPAKIDALFDMIAPYMVMNPEGTQFVLREDAPNEIKKAKQECDRWWEENRSS